MFGYLWDVHVTFCIMIWNGEPIVKTAVQNFPRYCLIVNKWYGYNWSGTCKIVCLISFMYTSADQEGFSAMK